MFLVALITCKQQSVITHIIIYSNLGRTNPFLGRPAATSGLPIKPYLHQPEGGVGNHQRKGKENLDKEKKMKVIAFLS